MGPTLSVVIPTYDRLPSLRRTLEGLAGQTGLESPVEVVVVSDGSTDGTDAYLASGLTPLPVVALTQANAGPAAARNRGLDAATGEIILFIDDDVVPAPVAVARHLAHHGGPGADGLVVIGPMLTPHDVDLSSWVAWEQAMLEKQYDAMNRGLWSATARQFYTGNASVSAHRLREIGGFDPEFRRAEDVELAFRLADSGCDFHFDPTAIVWHYAERSFRSWRGVARAYGHNDVIFARDRGRTAVLENMATEFHQRSRLIRVLNEVTLPRQRLARGTASALSGVARLADRLHLTRVSAPVLSALYSLDYYGGVADELGDPAELLGMIEEAA